MTRERPIIFSAPMVRAILDGRKTQTRRVVKLPHSNPLGRWEPGEWGGPRGGRTRTGDTVPHQGVLWHTRTGDSIGCPYGQPGDRLWVRESFIHEPADYCWEASVSIPSRPASTVYRADCGGDTSGHGWKSPIHMPRNLSRLTLEIAAVRVERLQDISGDDCIAEGVGEPVGTPLRYGSVTAAWNRREFQRLWEQINGPDSWAANPWVWVIEFRRIEA